MPSAFNATATYMNLIQDVETWIIAHKISLGDLKHVSHDCQVSDDLKETLETVLENNTSSSLRILFHAAILSRDWRCNETHSGHIAAWRVAASIVAERIENGLLYRDVHRHSVENRKDVNFMYLLDKLRGWSSGKLDMWPFEQASCVPQMVVFELTPPEQRTVVDKTA